MRPTLAIIVVATALAVSALFVAAGFPTCGTPAFGSAIRAPRQSSHYPFGYYGPNHRYPFGAYGLSHRYRFGYYGPFGRHPFGYRYYTYEPRLFSQIPWSNPYYPNLWGQPPPAFDWLFAEPLLELQLLGLYDPLDPPAPSVWPTFGIDPVRDPVEW